MVEDACTWLFDTCEGELVNSGAEPNWEPFDSKNSLLLENAHQNRRSKCLLRCGRREVDLATRQMHPVYWDGSGTRVMRARWFWLKGSQFIPYTEMEQERIQKIYCLKKFNEPLWLTDMKHCVVFHHPTVPFSLKVLDKQVPLPGFQGLIQHQNNGKGTPRKLTRIGPTPKLQGGRENEEDVSPPTHLVFVIHGIGEAEWAKTDVWKFENRVSVLRARAEELSGKMAERKRVEFLPVSWFDVVHQTRFKQQMDDVTLNNLEGIRNFANAVLIDVMFYMSPAYHLKIQQAVVNRMNTLFALFCHHNPHFNQSNVSVIGHSLGSIISFDVLASQAKFKRTVSSSTNPFFNEERADTVSRATPGKEAGANWLESENQGLEKCPRLKFEVRNFFALGSPIGFFLSIRGATAASNLRDAAFKLHTGTTMLNIFHPHDPVAYRIEPLAHPLFRDVPPVVIPHHKASGKRTHVALAEKWRNIWSKAEDEQQVPKNDGARSEMLFVLQTLGIFSGGTRIDYILQESTWDSMNPLPFLTTSKAHCCYFTSDDTILLMLAQIWKSDLVAKRDVSETTEQAELRPAKADTSMEESTAASGARDTFSSPSDSTNGDRVMDSVVVETEVKSVSNASQLLGESMIESSQADSVVATPTKVPVVGKGKQAANVSSLEPLQLAESSQPEVCSPQVAAQEDFKQSLAAEAEKTQSQQKTSKEHAPAPMQASVVVSEATPSSGQRLPLNNHRPSDKIVPFRANSVRLKRIVRQPSNNPFAPNPLGGEGGEVNANTPKTNPFGPATHTGTDKTDADNLDRMNSTTDKKGDSEEKDCVIC